MMTSKNNDDNYENFVDNFSEEDLARATQEFDQLKANTTKFLTMVKTMISPAKTPLEKTAIINIDFVLDIVEEVGYYKEEEQRDNVNVQ